MAWSKSDYFRTLEQNYGGDYLKKKRKKERNL